MEEEITRWGIEPPQIDGSSGSQTNWTTMTPQLQPKKIHITYYKL